MRSLRSATWRVYEDGHCEQSGVDWSNGSKRNYVMHSVEIEQYRTAKGRLAWWADCSCGEFQGCRTRKEAAEWKRDHESTPSNPSAT